MHRQSNLSAKSKECYLKWADSENRDKLWNINQFGLLKWTLVWHLQTNGSEKHCDRKYSSK